MDDEDVSLSCERVTPRRCYRRDWNIWYRREVIMEPLDITLLSSKINRPTVHACATRVSPGIEFTSGFFSEIGGRRLHVIGLGRFKPFNISSGSGSLSRRNGAHHPSTRVPNLRGRTSNQIFTLVHVHLLQHRTTIGQIKLGTVTSKPAPILSSTFAPTCLRVG